MRILVLSDSHGQAGAVFRAVEAQPTARVVIHLGDGAREAAEITDRYPDRTVYSVQGSCDAVYGSTLRPYQEETLGGKRFFFTHGHLFGVKTVTGWNVLRGSGRRILCCSVIRMWR